MSGGPAASGNMCYIDVQIFRCLFWVNSITLLFMGFSLISFFLGCSLSTVMFFLFIAENLFLSLIRSGLSLCHETGFGPVGMQPG